MTSPAPPPPPAGGEPHPGDYGPQPGLPPQPSYGYPAAPGVPAAMAHDRPTGELGRMRPTGLTILLVIVTLGIWGLVYYYQVFEEMRRHSGRGLGGVLALVISIIVS